MAKIIPSKISKPQSLRVLMLEDSESDEQLIIRELKKGGYKPEYERMETAAEMKKALKEKQWDIILCDYKMPKFNAPSAITLFHETNIDIPLIIVSGAIGEERAVECMRSGAHDYIMKNNLSRLCPAIARELEEVKVRNKQKQTDELLQESKKELQGLFKSMINAFVIFESIFDDDGNFASYRFVYINDAYEFITGLKNEDVKGKTVHEVWPGTEPEWIKRYGEVAVTGVTQKFELYHDPTKKIYLCNVYRPWDTKDRFCVIFEDITSRKHAEEELRESEELFRNYLENAPDGVYMNDMKGNFIYGNRKCEEILGYRREELIGKNFLELNILPEQSLNKAVQLLQENTKGKPTGPDELELISKEGRLIPVEINTSVVQRLGQGIVLAFVRDITERKQVEEVLRASEERFRSVVEKSSVGIAIVDDKFLCTYVNNECCNLSGYSEQELVGINFTFLLAEESKILAAERYQSRQRGEDVPAQYEFTFVQKNGKKRTGEVRSAVYLDSSGKAKSLIQVIDITDRHQVEQKLQVTLESLRKAVSTTIQVMVSAIESRDPYTSGHQVRSANLARTIATEMGLSQDKIEGIRMAGLIHDIGKLSIPAEILSKPTKLSEIEFRLIKEHAQKGYEMLKDVESPWPLAEIVYQHHERMDGSGYPRNLKGKEILMEARIMAVADVVEAIASHRPYRPSLGIDAALEEIEKNRGTLYDEAVVYACLRLFREKSFQMEVT